MEIYNIVCPLSLLCVPIMILLLFVHVTNYITYMTNQVFVKSNYDRSNIIIMFTVCSDNPPHALSYGTTLYLILHNWPLIWFMTN